MRKKYTYVLLTLFLTFAVAGCKAQNPVEKATEEAAIKQMKQDFQKLVGEWRGVGTRLIIAGDGMVKYKAIGKKVTGPVKKLGPNSFRVGVLFITYNFVIEEWPHKVGSDIKMKVNGNELTKVEPLPWNPED